LGREDNPPQEGKPSTPKNNATKGGQEKKWGLQARPDNFWKKKGHAAKGSCPARSLRRISGKKRKNAENQQAGWKSFGGISIQKVAPKLGKGSGKVQWGKGIKEGACLSKGCSRSRKKRGGGSATTSNLRWKRCKGRKK